MSPRLAFRGGVDGWQCEAGTPRNPLEPPGTPWNFAAEPPVILQTPCAPEPYICSERHGVYLELAPTQPADRPISCSQSNRHVHTQKFAGSNLL